MYINVCLYTHTYNLSTLQAQKNPDSACIWSTLLTAVATCAWWLLENQSRSEELNLNPNLARTMQIRSPLLISFS